MFRYETHLHTAPVSVCAKVNVRKNLEFYKAIGYDGVFITNHFFDDDSSPEPAQQYEDLIESFCSDYEKGTLLEQELGIKVFFGLEFSYYGSDFLVYGLDQAWLLAHPEIMTIDRRDILELFFTSGALVIHAHPFREGKYIDHIRLFPRHVHGVEIMNAGRTDLENEMASLYAKQYGLLPFAGSDNHRGARQARLAGMESDTPVHDARDFIRLFREGSLRPFSFDNPGLRQP